MYSQCNFNTQIKFQEWRSNQFFEKLEEIKYDLITRYMRLKKSINNLTEMDDTINDEDIKKKNESINNSASNDKKYKKKNSSLQSDLLSDKSRQIKDYIGYMKQKYEDFEKNSAKYGIPIIKENYYEVEPIIELDDLIDLNKKINKKQNDSLRMQFRLCNCYRRWATLNTLLYLNKNKNKNNNITNDNEKTIKTIEQKEGNKNEDSIVKEEKSLSLEDEGFIPLENFTSMKIIYYSNIKIIFIYIIFILSIIAGIITVFFEILLLFELDIIFKLLQKINNIFVIHFVILIPLIYLICMSNYTLFKIKLSSYIYMYGHRQTDSVSLMIFSSYLSRIYFAICLNFLQTLNQFKNEKKSLFEKFFNIVQDKEESNFIIKLCRYSPCILLIFMFLFFFNVPGKIGNFVGCILFEFESEERDTGIKDGHKYLMTLNKKLNGKQLGHNDSKIFEDK